MNPHKKNIMPKLAGACFLLLAAALIIADLITYSDPSTPIQEPERPSIIMEATPQEAMPMKHTLPGPKPICRILPAGEASSITSQQKT